MIGFCMKDPTEPQPPVVTIEQDGGDVNILLNEHTVAYFNQQNGKLSLMGLGEGAKAELTENGVVITPAGFVATDMC